MSPARRTLQIPLSAIGRTAIAVVILLIGLSGNMSAGTTERIVANPNTGLAIDGYDPVAYFADGEPRLGTPEREFSYGGVVWRFRNEGNQAAFVAHPDIYAPCFGGYDPVGIARGVALPGHPLLFSIIGERLCLFYSEAERRQFLADPKAILRAANERWPEVRATLAQ